MATTTNYGWDTPDDTDLVKDGALAIRDLGQDVDTSLFGITGGKNVGEQFIAGATFSGTSSLEFTNVFSDTYRFYRFYCDWLGSASTDLEMQFRENTTNKNTSYYAGGNFGSILGATGAYATRNNNVSFYIAAHGTTVYSEAIILINRPAATQGNINVQTENNASDLGGTFSGTNFLMTNFTGFRIFPTTGTISGHYTLTGIKA
jgi:hypothetical protein